MIGEQAIQDEIEPVRGVFDVNVPRADGLS